jgi:hypothetical protein
MTRKVINVGDLPQAWSDICLKQPKLYIQLVNWSDVSLRAEFS